MPAPVSEDDRRENPKFLCCAAGGRDRRLLRVHQSVFAAGDPALAVQEFGAGAAEISAIITVSTLAVAVTAPFTGAVADVLGRKRVIVAAMFTLAVPTLMVGLSPASRR